MASDAGCAKELRFLHIADLRWERVLPLDPDMPTDLQTAIVDAKPKALAKALQQAQEHLAQFVLVVGRTFTSHRTTPGLLATLIEGVLRGQSPAVPIFWYWPGPPLSRFVSLPPQVTIFRKATVVRTSQGEELAELLPLTAEATSQENPKHFQRGHRGKSVPGRWQLRVGVVSDPATLPPLMEALPGAYWALGGSRPHLISHGRQLAHWPGAIQADRLTDYGPHGATLVILRPHKPPKLIRLWCDQVRVARVHLHVEGPFSPSDLLKLVEEKIRRICAAWPDHPALLHWVVHVGAEALSTRPWRWLSADHFRYQLLERYGSLQPARWTVTVTISPHGPPRDVDGPTHFLALLEKELTRSQSWAKAVKHLEDRLRLWLGVRPTQRILTQLFHPRFERLNAAKALWEAYRLLDAGGPSP